MKALFNTLRDFKMDFQYEHYGANGETIIVQDGLVIIHHNEASIVLNFDEEGRSVLPASSEAFEVANTLLTDYLRDLRSELFQPVKQEA